MFSRLNRRQKAKTLNQPGLVVESAEVFEGCDQFRDRLEVADPEQLLLERFEEAFDTTVALRFADERRRRLDAQETEPTAFSVRYKGIKVTQLTDLGWIPDHVADWMKGSHVLILESNHDLDMLRVGPYPWSLKERLVGRNGHLSNATVGRYLSGPFDGQARHIVLAHLSAKNNHPEIARLEACHGLSARGLAEASVSVASQDTPSTPIELG